MPMLIKCSFCKESKTVAWGPSEGVTQISISGPMGNSYLVNCGCAKPADVATAVKELLTKK